MGSYISIFSCHDGFVGSVERGAVVTARVMWINAADCCMVGDMVRESSVSSSMDVEMSIGPGEKVGSGDELGDGEKGLSSESLPGTSITSCARAFRWGVVETLVDEVAMGAGAGARVFDFDFFAGSLVAAAAESFRGRPRGRVGEAGCWPDGGGSLTRAEARLSFLGRPLGRLGEGGASSAGFSRTGAVAAVDIAAVDAIPPKAARFLLAQHSWSRAIMPARLLTALKP